MRNIAARAFQSGLVPFLLEIPSACPHAAARRPGATSRWVGVLAAWCKAAAIGAGENGAVRSRTATSIARARRRTGTPTGPGCAGVAPGPRQTPPAAASGRARAAAGGGGKAWDRKPARPARRRARQDGRGQAVVAFHIASADRYSRLIQTGFWPEAPCLVSGTSYEFRSNFAAEGLHHHIRGRFWPRGGAPQSRSSTPGQPRRAIQARPRHRPPIGARAGLGSPAAPPGASTRQCRQSCRSRGRTRPTAVWQGGPGGSGFISGGRREHTHGPGAAHASSRRARWRGGFPQGTHSTSSRRAHAGRFFRAHGQRAVAHGIQGDGADVQRAFASAALPRGMTPTPSPALTIRHSAS